MAGSKRRGTRLFRSDPGTEADEELAFHIEERAAEYERGGMDAESARAAARARLGDLERVRSDCTHLLAAERRTESRRDWLGDLGQDARFAVRSATRAPLFTLLAVVTLALGIGANAAIGAGHRGTTEVVRVCGCDGDRCVGCVLRGWRPHGDRARAMGGAVAPRGARHLAGARPALSGGGRA